MSNLDGRQLYDFQLILACVHISSLTHDLENVKGFEKSVERLGRVAQFVMVVGVCVEGCMFQLNDLSF